ncbi:MAG: RecX family transcriptional regulator [Clostridiales bacterium]|nr:RecX family transcriptional regulator [Clostridiales bacterium]
MSQITSIEPQIKDKTRCSIFVDGRFYCGIKLEVAVKYRLKAGMEIDRAELDKIQLETEKVQATEKALTHLSASLKTEKQMRDFLVKKGYVEAVVDYVMEKMHYYGYVNDAEYCKAYIGGISGKSRRAIEVELLKRGVDKETVRGALNDYEDDDELILSALKKYLRGKELTKENVYKACRYLVSKGYEYDAVKRVSERLGDDEDY